jgi:hypothetical protein
MVGRRAKNVSEVKILFFGHSDIEFLRLAAWCKNLPPDISDMFASQASKYGKPVFQVFDPMSIEFLVRLGLVNVTQDGKSIRLRDKGSRLLRYLGYRYHRDSKYRSDFGDRRVEIARILLTFWRAGFQVYAGALEDLGNVQVFLSSMAARQDKVANVWGGSVFQGLARIGQTVCACYCPGNEKEMRLNHRNERFVMGKAALRFSLREAMIFAGPDYVRLARAFRNNGKLKPADKEADLTLPQIRGMANHPVYLLPFGDAGAMQLRIMCERNYWERLSSAYFRSRNLEAHISAAPLGVTGADGMVAGAGPWLVAVDMDICRIDRALRQASAAGYGKLTLLCLKNQRRALRLLYSEEKAPILYLPDDCLINAFGELPLYAPPPSVYTSRKGVTVDASHLPVD